MPIDKDGEVNPFLDSLQLPEAQLQYPEPVLKSPKAALWFLGSYVMVHRKKLIQLIKLFLLFFGLFYWNILLSTLQCKF